MNWQRLFRYGLTSVLLITSTEVIGSELLLFICNYQQSVAADISKNLGIQIDQRTESKFTLKFTAAQNAKKGTIVGNAGAAEVSLIWGENKVTFVEVTGNGTVQTTAVYGLGFGRKVSVHSRTSGGEGFEMPSQYYGFCNIR